MTAFARLVGLALIALVLGEGFVSAQATTGRILGGVTYSLGAAFPGATVIVRNV